MILLLIAGVFLFSCEKEGDVIPDLTGPDPIGDVDSLDCDGDGIADGFNVPFIPTTLPTIDTFTFCYNGGSWNAKIYVPASYETNKNLPAIFLIDFTEQHFQIARDEFEKVIEGVQQIEGFEALVVSLEKLFSYDTHNPFVFEVHYELYKTMASYVDGRYTSNTSRTLIGRGSPSGIALMACFLDSSETPVFQNFITTDTHDNWKFEIITAINNGIVAQNMSNRKLHFSFSKSNTINSDILFGETNGSE